MSISDEDFAAWLRARDVPRVYLVEAGYGFGGEGGTGEFTAYASDTGYISHATDTPALTYYPEILASIPTIQFQADSLTVGEIEVINDGGALDGWLDRYWDGRDFKLLIGAPGWARADFRPVLSGTLAGIVAAGPDRLVWGIRDNRALLDVPVQPNKYPDTSGSNPNEGAPKPIALGFCYNVEPVWIPPDGSVSDIAATFAYNSTTGIATATTATAHGFTAGDVVEVYGTTDDGYSGVFEVATAPTTTTLTYEIGSVLDLGADSGTLAQGSLTYQVHDGAIEALVAVRDNGVAVSYAADLAAGTFALAAQPFGALRADVKGTKLSGAYISKSSDLVRWLFDHAGLSAALLDEAALTAWETTCPQEFGLYIRDERQVGDVVAEIAASLDSHTPFNRSGALFFWRLTEPAGSPVATFTEDDIMPDSLFPATIGDIIYKMLPGYRRNWAPVAEDSLAGSLSPATKRALSQEWRTAPYSHPSEAAILAAHPLAKDLKEVDFLFSHQTVSTAQGRATTEATRRINLYGQTRYTYRLSVWAAPGLVSVGDEISVTHPRFGFANGLGAIVVSLNEQPEIGRIDLEIWR